jgi:hypothetical protein
MNLPIVRLAACGLVLGPDCMAGEARSSGWESEGGLAIKVDNGGGIAYEAQAMLAGVGGAGGASGAMEHDSAAQMTGRVLRATEQQRRVAFGGILAESGKG